ncbi:peroxiredoxin-like family protein [Alteromonadaceae bacterium BrNp21-10]|nr:peroxiredoxin-like family protein [Alteromonadaceae bacterium BrNp21-10]
MKRKLFALITALALTLPALALDRTQIAASAEDVTPLLNGQSIPAVALKTVDGKTINLTELVASKPSIILFYRGGWCPYCSRQLAGLKDLEPKLKALGYQIIAISPDSATRLQSQKMTTEFSAMLLSDDQLNAIRGFGLGYFLDDKTAEMYRDKAGVEFVDIEGTSRVALPAPAVYIVDQAGLIKFNYVNPNFKVRVSEQLLYDAAKASLAQ